MKLEEKELARIKEAQRDFNQAKMTLADLVINQSIVTDQIKGMREGFADFESKLIDKYGKDSSINMETGVVTQEGLQKVT
jgi:hypothetical protein